MIYYKILGTRYFLYNKTLFQYYFRVTFTMIQRAKSKKNILKVDLGVLVIVVVLCGAR